MNFPNVPIPDSEVRQFRSSVTGRGYDLYIHIPGEYGLDLEKKYPVLYVLDGQWDFKLVDSICGGLAFDEFIPQTILVGIAYTGDTPDYGALRAVDYTPAAASDVPGSGDGPLFLRFFKEELLPFIESNYRAEPSQRVLAGASLGGLFTLYALFCEPGLFRGYIAASPTLTYADDFVFEQETEYANNHQDLPVRLFISFGELEELARPVQEFARILSKRAYTGLELETRTIEGERHASNKPESYNRGLRFMFQNKGQPAIRAK